MDNVEQLKSEITKLRNILYEKELALKELDRENNIIEQKELENRCLNKYFILNSEDINNYCYVYKIEDRELFCINFEEDEDGSIQFYKDIKHKWDFIREDYLESDSLPTNLFFEITKDTFFNAKYELMGKINIFFEDIK